MKHILATVFPIILALFGSPKAGPGAGFEEETPPVVDAVDLGIAYAHKDGSLYKLFWADRNLGALVPEDYGNYFAWGETKTKALFSQQNYVFGSVDNTNYNNTGGKIILEAEDDAATVELGAPWRIPTAEEWEGMSSNTEWDWVERNGVLGYDVTAGNGNSIYLPAAGYRFDDHLKNEAYDGRYWTSTVCDCIHAYNFCFFDETGWRIADVLWRSNGGTIRPVCESDAVWPESLTLSHTSLRIPAGSTVQLSASANPQGYETAIKWESSNQEVVFVSKNGRIRGKIQGKAVVTATFGNIRRSVDVEVISPLPVDLGTIFMAQNGTPYKLYWADRNFGALAPEDSGDYFDLGIIEDPESDPVENSLGYEWRKPTREELDALRKQCSWTQTTLNGVDGSRVTGIDGNSIFIPSADSADIYCIRPVYVGEKGQELSPDKLSLNITSVNMQVGTSCEIIATAVPELFEPVLDWRTSDYGIVAVQFGKLVAKAPGRASVTVSYGSRSVQCQVNVTSREAPPGAVDMGIVMTKVSGTSCRVYKVFWADCNLGASKPGEAGNLYAWGETSPKNSFSWSNYKWCSGGKNKLTKFCPADKADSWAGDGRPDNLTSLNLSQEDDAVRRSLGGKWRIPTYEEWEALKNQCVWNWKMISQNGGFFVISKNGNSIFIPATKGVNGRYWSSSLYLDNPSKAKALSFKSGQFNQPAISRGEGLSIRPVTE